MVGVVDARRHLTDEIIPSDLACAAVIPLLEGGLEIRAIVCGREAASIGQFPQARLVQVRRTTRRGREPKEDATHLLLRFLRWYQDLFWVLVLLLAQPIECP